VLKLPTAGGKKIREEEDIKRNPEIQVQDGRPGGATNLGAWPKNDAGLRIYGKGEQEQLMGNDKEVKAKRIRFHGKTRDFKWGGSTHGQNLTHQGVRKDKQAAPKTEQPRGIKQGVEVLNRSIRDVG